MNTNEILSSLRLYLKTGKANTYTLTKYSKLLKVYGDKERLTDDIVNSKSSVEARLQLSLALVK